MENEVLTPTEETPETTDAFLADWDTDGEEDSETTETEAPESHEESPEQEQGAEPLAADQPQEESGKEGHPPEKPEDAPTKTWTLKHLGADKTVDEQEITALAQKGLDYDRVRQKYDESKPILEVFTQMAKQAGTTVPDYVAFLRTEAKKSSGMNEDEARRAVELENREVAAAAKEAEEAGAQTAAQKAAQEESSAKARREAEIAEFQKAFPDAAKDVKSIPPEVWNSVKREGYSLTTAYALWHRRR